MPYQARPKHGKIELHVGLNQNKTTVLLAQHKHIQFLLKSGNAFDFLIN